MQCQRFISCSDSVLFDTVSAFYLMQWQRFIWCSDSVLFYAVTAFYLMQCGRFIWCSDSVLFDTVSAFYLMQWQRFIWYRDIILFDPVDPVTVFYLIQPFKFPKQIHHDLNFHPEKKYVYNINSWRNSNNNNTVKIIDISLI